MMLIQLWTVAAKMILSIFQQEVHT